MQIPSLSVMWAFVVGCLASQAKAYPSGGWPMYVQAPREYPEEDYYYSPKMQYYYGAPAKHVPEVYGRVPYPYYYDPYAHYAEEDPVSQEERLANLPVGQETWFESETEPSWRSSDMDDVNAAFLDNLILTQMAQDAQRRRELARSSQTHANDYEERDLEDEDVRELKALAGKPLYHVPKTSVNSASMNYGDDDYPADEGFINWNGNKRNAPTQTPALATVKPKEGQDEIMVPRPATQQNHHHHHDKVKAENSVYEKITRLLAAEAKMGHEQNDEQKPRRLDKRFVATDADLVAELRGLKQRIRT